MWARVVVRGCRAVQTSVTPGRALCRAVQTGVLPGRTLCQSCLRSLVPLVGGNPITTSVLSEGTHSRPVHTSSVPPKVRLKKRFRKEKKRKKSQRLDTILPEDADGEDALDVTSLEEERDRIIYLVQERLKTNRKKERRFSGTQHYRPNVVRVVDALQAQRLPSNLIIDTAIVTSNPRVVKLQEEEIDRVLNALRSTLNSKLIQNVVEGNPQVLLMDPKKIIARFQKLTELFHRSEVVQLVGRNPSLMTCEWDEVEEKYWYVTDVMGVNADQMVKTNVMTHSLEHIITRHTFLERAGLYERPNKHGATSIQNATLRQIVDLDDDHFAPLCGAGMSAGEYRTFARLLELERRQEQEEEGEEDLEEDEDSESLDVNVDNR